MQNNTTNISPLDYPLRYDELLHLCKIIGIELNELAKPMGFSSKGSLYETKRQKSLLDRKVVIPLSRLDGIIAKIGEPDYIIAVEELSLTPEERENPRNTKRITWGEGKKILKICGVPMTALAKSINLTTTTVSYYMGWYTRRLIPLRDVHAFKKLVGERNFERALAIVRK